MLTLCVSSWSVCLWQKSSKLSKTSSVKDDLEKDGKDDDQKSGSKGGDPDKDIIQNTTDSKVGFNARMLSIRSIINSQMMWQIEWLSNFFDLKLFNVLSQYVRKTT